MDIRAQVMVQAAAIDVNQAIIRQDWIMVQEHSRKLSNAIDCAIAGENGDIVKGSDLSPAYPRG